MAEKILGRNAAYRKKGRPPTKGGFRKGNDSRRNKHGQRNAKAVAFFRTLRELIVTEGEKNKAGIDDDGNTVKLKKVEWYVKVLWQEALKGEAWAVQFIAEKVEGKVEQPIALSFTLSERYLPKDME